MVNRIFIEAVKAKENFEINKILYLFRYASLFVTSFFFMVNQPMHDPARKVFIVFCISVAAILLNTLYIHTLSKTLTMLSLILIEAVFNAFILIPSGGLDSPYIWYSLNTILIVSVALKRRIFAWINLFIYLFSSTWIFCSLLETRDNFVNVLKKESNLILSLVLITGAIQILAHYSRKLEEKGKILEEANNKILSANSKIKESMNYIMELYQAVHLLTTQQDRNNLVCTILEYTGKITKAGYSFFINNDVEGIKKTVTVYPDCREIKDRIKASLPIFTANLDAVKAPARIVLDAAVYFLVPVKCHYDVFGLLGVQISGNPDLIDCENLSDQLRFISELGTISFEKFNLEQVNKRLLINEEQNRIANEIHDGVLQKLFGISCGLYGLMKQAGSASARKMEKELSAIKSSVTEAMADLRSIIYGYSWKKKGANNFMLDIQSLIDATGRYHETDISFELKGNQELLAMDHKKAFYRIISESIGNAIRHGNAKNIRVIADVGINEILLKIEDDGIGFNPEILKNSDKQGMGIRNIYTLTQSLQGSVQMDSEPGGGTVVSIRVPVDMQVYREDIV